MKKPRQILRKLMERRGMTPEGVARAVGISIRTLENLLSGSPSRIARQRITDLFGETSIWPGVLPSPCLIRFSAGTEIQLETEGEARAFSRGFGSNILLVGKSIRFVLPTHLAVQLPIAISTTNNNEREK